MKFFSVMLFGFAMACSNSGSNGIVATDSSVYEADFNDLEGLDAAGDEIIFEKTSAPAEQREAQIIKTARLVFESQDPAATHQRILDLTSQHKGFVQSENAGKSYNRVFTTITLRVPTAQFQDFIEGVSEGVNYFDQKDISRRDVTEEFVDLEARLKAKRELETRYLELLKQAKNVKEMLEIERELSTIREEIEAKMGRLNYLKDQVSMSTVSIEFYQTTADTGVTLSYGQKMKNALKGGWDGISMFFIGILYLWPLFLVGVILFFVIRKLIKRNKAKAS